jgi:hypothetical protein
LIIKEPNDLFCHNFETTLWAYSQRFKGVTFEIKITIDQEAM